MSVLGWPDLSGQAAAAAAAELAPPPGSPRVWRSSVTVVNPTVGGMFVMSNWPGGSGGGGARWGVPKASWPPAPARAPPLTVANSGVALVPESVALFPLVDRQRQQIAGRGLFFRDKFFEIRNSMQTQLFLQKWIISFSKLSAVAGRGDHMTSGV